MPDKDHRSFFKKLGFKKLGFSKLGFSKLRDLLETRVDVLAFLRELALETGACSRVTRRSFGYSPTIIVRRIPPKTRARLLFFPARQSDSTKAV